MTPPQRELADPCEWWPEGIPRPWYGGVSAAAAERGDPAVQLRRHKNCPAIGNREGGVADVPGSVSTRWRVCSLYQLIRAESARWRWTSIAEPLVGAAPGGGVNTAGGGSATVRRRSAVTDESDGTPEYVLTTRSAQLRRLRVALSGGAWRIVRATSTNRPWISRSFRAAVLTLSHDSNDHRHCDGGHGLEN